MAAPLTTAPSPARNEQLRKYVESHHIDHIPTSVRHGKAWHQFAFWWGTNVNVFNLVLGGIAASFIGLTFWWSLIAVAVGTLIGALLIALHATQGPSSACRRRSRAAAQFGFYGSAFLFPCVLVLNVGFIAAQLVIQAQALEELVTALTIPEWILILTVPSVVIGIFGYRWIHRVVQATAVLVGVSLIVMLIQGLGYRVAARASEMTLATPHAGLFLAGRGAAGHRHALVRPVRIGLHPLPARGHERASGCSGPSTAANVAATFFSCAIGAYLTALLPSPRAGRARSARCPGPGRSSSWR